MRSVRVQADGRLRPQLTDRRVSSPSCSTSAFSSVALRYGVSISSCVCAVAPGQGLQFLQASAALAGLLRQVADEGEALAVQPAGGQRQQQRAGAGQRHDDDAQRMRRGHGRGAGVGDGRQPGLGDQAHILAGQGRGEQFAPQPVARCRVAGATALGRARQLADVDGLQRLLQAAPRRARA